MVVVVVVIVVSMLTVESRRGELIRIPRGGLTYGRENGRWRFALDHSMGGLCFHETGIFALVAFAHLSYLEPRAVQINQPRLRLQLRLLTLLACARAGQPTYCVFGAAVARA